jgi:hypothetical protein
MKAAALKSSLLMRKGAATPVNMPSPHEAHPPLGGVVVAHVGAAPEPGALRRDRMGRVRHSLRLDPQRHLRLKLLAAHTQQSLQEILLAALDDHLARHGDGVLDGHCACLSKGELSDECAEPCTAKT